MRDNGNNRNNSDDERNGVGEERGRVGDGDRALNSLTLSLNPHSNATTTIFAILFN